MAKFKFGIKSDTLLSVSAMLAALAAVVVAVMQTQIMREEAELEREHARLSVMPSIMLLYSNGTSANGTRFFELNIQNLGLGPAVIEDFSITYKGVRMKNQRSWVHAVADDAKKQNLLTGNYGIQNSFAGNGRVVPVEKTLNPIRVDHDQLALLLQEAFKDTEFSLCVCSFYGDCQRVDDLATRPVSVKTCTREDDEQS